MLASSEILRPLPPAKARRAAAAQRLRMSSTPPPAYGSPFTFPSRRSQPPTHDILESPTAIAMEQAVKGMDWNMDSSRPPLLTTPFHPPLALGDDEEQDDVGWLDERSRVELAQLLIKADDIIKERENELGLTSAVCKSLYENNVVLKSKHEALLSRLPVSPPRSMSSPSNLSCMGLPANPMVISQSTSESGMVQNQSDYQHLSHSRGHMRKVSMSNADVSFLADQNAELMDKLERLEEEATSTDQAGRRELRRLEKEITYLREALEKTQAKSEELEEKVQDAVVGEALRRKKEREAKFGAMRKLTRDSGDDEQDNGIRDFAPGGSKFGGPSEGFSFLPASQSSSLSQFSGDASSSDNISIAKGSPPRPENPLISQLLDKVRELEAANARILQQQAETATRLTAVQRDTEQISKVYECLVDPDSVELDLDNDAVPETREVGSSGTIRFRSLRKNIEREMSREGTCIIHRDITAATKSRKTVMGLFDEPTEGPSTTSTQQSTSQTRYANEDVDVPFDSSSWMEGYHHSSFSSFSHMPDALSPLHFFSPPSRILQELSPAPNGPTLQSELNEQLGETWELGGGNHHRRTSSLLDMSQISVPATPSPPSRNESRRPSDELNFESLRSGLGFVPMSKGVLRLSVEPPTPLPDENPDDQADLDMRTPKSPRMQVMMDTIRSRNDRWATRRFFNHDFNNDKKSGLRKRGWSKEREQPMARPRTTSMSVKGLGILNIPQQLSDAVDNMMGELDMFTDAAPSNDEHQSESSSPVLSDDNALQLHVHSSPQKQGGERRNTGSLIVEIWLWIQLALIVFVFLWNVAKRGPRNVLQVEGEQGAVARRR